MCGYFCGLDHKVFLFFVWAEIRLWSGLVLALIYYQPTVALSNVGLYGIVYVQSATTTPV